MAQDEIGCSRSSSGRASRSSLPSLYRNSTAILPWILCAGLILAGASAQAGGVLPTNGQYVAGQGTISGNTNSLTINQSSNNGIINWQGFSIGAGNSVQFNNGSGSTLNRVTGADISHINGQLSATGSLYLINPQGIVIGPGGKVVTSGSFVASTRDIADSAFMSGGAMSASGSSNGDVVNAGTITSRNGDAILVGRSVSNSGKISAPNGSAKLAAGNQILLQPVNGDPRIAVSGGTGDVTNSGTIAAAQIQLSSAGGNVYAVAGNNGGLISATGTKTIDGHVWLTASGTTESSGTVSAVNADGSGGAVTVRGTDINLSGVIDASASAVNAKGGDISIIATANTKVAGKIKAVGGTGGQGGAIETSGNTLSFDGGSVEAGMGGSWLLDPSDFTIDAYWAPIISSNLSAGAYVSVSANDIIIASPLAWGTAKSLTLYADHSIYINAPVTISGGGSLLLNTNVNGGSGGVYSFGNGGSISFTGGAAAGAQFLVNGAAYTLLYSLADVQGIGATDLNLQQNYALATSLDATGLSGWTPLGTDSLGTILNAGAGFSGVFEGLGHTISNLTINSPSHSYTGLFGVSAGTIRDIGIVGGSVSGAYYTGGLVGVNYGTITNAYVTSAVVGNRSYIGGLVGANSGTITRSYATGSVSGDVTGGNGFYIGGLVGSNVGSITDAYATGAVSGTAFIGGLVGVVNSGTITNVYATGAVEGGSSIVGGLAGANQPGSTISGYWDVETSGTAIGLGGSPNSSGVTGLTTAQLQGALPSGFSSAVWGTGSGLYPYFLWQYPTASGAPQAISGIAYNSGGGTALAGATVTALMNGNSLGSVTTGANGYYYFLEAPGTITVNSNVLAYTSGALGGVRVDTLSGTTSGFDIWGSTLIAPTSAATYSTASATTLQSQDAALLASATGGNSAVQALAAGLATYGYIATGSSFTLDTPLTLSNGLYVRSRGDLTVAKAITLPGSNGLTLSAAGALAVNAPITVSGAGRVGLDAGLMTLACGCASISDLSFGQGASIDYGSTNNGGRLTVNGEAYTLLYTMADVQAVNASDAALQRNYALATSLDATSTLGWIPLGVDSAGTVLNTNRGFSGIFEGLGHTVSNLTVDVGGRIVGGMFGVVYGTIRDMSLANVSVTGTGGIAFGGVVGALSGTVAQVSVSGSVNDGTVTNVNVAGGLVGINTGVVVRSNASVAVSGGDASYSGGLVGMNQSTGTILQSYATGTVAAQRQGSVGGLVGTNDGSIVQSYASGSATGGDYGSHVGGLVGDNDGSITQSYATGAVHAGLNVGSFITSVGGLVGENESRATIHESYSTGMVSSSDAAASVGGFIGNNDSPTPTNVDVNYFDTQTSGTHLGIGTGNAANGVTGLTTAQLQASLPTRFDSTVWGVVTGKSYSYFLWQYPTAPDIVSGVVYTSQGGSAVAGETIKAVVGGSIVGTASSGANGYYNILLQSGTITTTGVMAYYQTTSNGGSTFADGLAGSVTGLDIYDNLRILTTDATLATTSANFSSTIGTLFGAGVTTLSSFLSANGPDLLVEASNASGFTVDQTINGAKAVTIQAAGDLTIALGATVNGTGSGNAVVLSTLGNFVNHQGSDAIGVTGAGRWLVYSSAPAGDRFGALDSANTAIWDETITALAPGSVTQSGNRYLFAYQPTVTFKPTNDSKTYGSTLNVSGDYTVSGIQAAVTGAYLGDTAATAYAGAVTVSSAGAAAAAQVAGSPYDITLLANGLTGLNGYAVAIDNSTAGQLTIAQKNLTITADNAHKTYGDLLSFVGTEFGVSGLVNADAVTSLSLTSSGANAAASVLGGPYTILGSAAAGSGLGNYRISYVAGTLTVDARAITVTANAQSRYYGNANPTLTYGVTSGNLANGDTLSGNLATLASLTSNVGGYGITQGTLAASANYAVSYVGGTLSVAARPITVTANNANRLYGDTNPMLAYGVTSGNLVNGDTLSGNIATAASLTSNVGGYGITQGTLAASSNYAVSYVGGTLTVAARPITITASDLSRLYGDANPTLSYVIGGNGLVNGDALSGNLATAASLTSNVGGYSITQGTLAASSNYAVSYVGGTLSVAARPITVTASDGSRLYGDTNPTLTYRVTSGSLVNGDVLSGLVATSATATSNVGGYGITQGTLASTANYSLVYTSGTLAVTARSLTVTANDLSRIYGNANPTLSYTIGGNGLVNGDSLSGQLATSATTNSNVGSYGITQGALTAGTNYLLSYLPGTLTVNPATLTASLKGTVEKIYNGSTIASLVASNYSLVGIFESDNVTLNNPISGTYDNKNAGAGKTVSVSGLVLSGAAAGNYVLAATSVNANVGIVDAALLTITADNFSAPTLAMAHPTVNYAGFVAGEDSALVSGLQIGLLPVTGNSLNYDIVPFGASAPNYAIRYLSGLLTLNPLSPTEFASPLIGNGGYGLLSSFVVTGSFGALSLSNVVTAAIGDEPNILVFQLGAAGFINPLDSITITDYSNATNSNDRLVHAL